MAKLLQIYMRSKTIADISIVLLWKTLAHIGIQLDLECLGDVAVMCI